MNFSWEAGPGRVEIEMRRCFAHEGMQALGCAAEYQCGIYERVLSWLSSVGVSHEVEPSDRLCLMHHRGSCRKVIRYGWSGTAADGAA